jgi:hypothetical protein
MDRAAGRLWFGKLDESLLASRKPNFGPTSELPTTANCPVNPGVLSVIGILQQLGVKCWGDGVCIFMMRRVEFRLAVHFLSMRYISLVAALLLPLTVLTQDVKRPVLSSHDRVDGPLGGEYQVEDLQIFADGKVVYVEEATKTMGGKAKRSAFEAAVGSDEMRSLSELLDSHEIRSLPKKVSSKTRPIDFF